MKKLLARSTGVVLAFVLAVPAWVLGSLVPIVGAPVFAILIGMALSFFRRPAILEEGIRFSGKRVLPYAIVFLGFSLDLGVVVRVGGQSLAVMIFTLSAAFLTAYLAGKALRLDTNVKILIGVGTSICGGSAIAAAAPVIQASDDEVTFAISTIFLFNIVAVFLFPVLGHLMRMSDSSFGLWAGTAINDTSSVVAAAFSYGDAAGRFATVVKLTRTLMIIPVTFGLALIRARGARAGGGGGGEGEREGTGGRFDIVKIIPWFVLGFLVASLVRSLGVLSAAVTTALNETGKFGICVAMLAIGLNANPTRLVHNGARPILLGLACWAVVALVSLAVQSVAG
jgi:uncharacterized integral membrane protein (TIGR00698 family)